MNKKNYSSISPTVWLSLATSSFLLGLVAVRALGQTIGELSQASEEIFRGDRLPILHVPKSNEQIQDISDEGS